VAGFGMGMTFAPLQTIAMLNVAPRMAGAASGVINTSRQLGGVIGSAAIGALLQDQLVAKLSAAAQANATHLDPPFRDRVVEGFPRATSGGLKVGAGQTGAALPPGIPPDVRPVLLAAAQKTFHEGYTAAMRVTLVLPIAVLGVAALSCLLVKRRNRPAGNMAAG